MVLSPGELLSLYKGLVNDRNDADDLMWQMSAAHNEAVGFLDEALPVRVA